jgi:hypothetical protein
LETSYHNFSYATCLAASERNRWRVEDVIGGDRRLDFTRPFLPESLAGVEPLAFLTPLERLALNQIRGHAYLRVFELVGEFTLPFVLDHARTRLSEDHHRVRALLAFACEQAKHIHLFRRFGGDFEHGFGSPCAVIGPPQAMAKQVLSHDPLAVALFILHFEWFTQAHYLESVKDDGHLDPQFKSLLRHHWIEGAQHARIDTLVVEALAERRGQAAIQSAVDEYFAIGTFLDKGLEQQVQLDLSSFELATGRRLDAAQRAEFAHVQHQANRWTFLGSGMTHPNVMATFDRLSGAARERLQEVALTFC